MTPRAQQNTTVAARNWVGPAPAALLVATLAASLLGYAAGAPPAAAAGAASPLLGGVEEMAVVPGGPWRAARVAGSDALYFVSGNGRWVVKGEAYDLWGGERLGDFEAMRASTRSIRLNGLGPIWNDLAPVSFGDGDEDVVVFSDPRCPTCEALIHRLRSFEDRYRIVVLQIPILGEASGRIVKTVHCAQDADAARAVVRDGAPAAKLAVRPDCDGEAILRRIATAQLIGLQGVPFMIHAPSGRFIEGEPDDLAAWLEAGR